MFIKIMIRVNRFIVVLCLLIAQSDNKVLNSINNHMINACGYRMVYVNGQYRNTCNEGYITENNICVPYTLPKCPVGYFLMNGLCYIQNLNYCFEGYYLSNGICYPTTSPPCDDFKLDPPSELKPIADDFSLPKISKIHCPRGSVFIENECRKILCPIGEYYQGQCLQPVCPEGTIWSGRRCEELEGPPLEIENTIISTAPDRPDTINQQNIDHYFTSKTEFEDSTYTTAGPGKTIIQIPTSPPLSPTSPGGICCMVLTPRICKLYGKKWVCFNRQSKRCDADLCSRPKIYLLVPEPIYDPPTLVMPPNPPLEACSTPECENTNNVNCSGCKSNRREECSIYCYHYLCPGDQCAFVDLKEYCIRNPDEFGCARSDGCLWDWCRAKDCSK